MKNRFHLIFDPLSFTANNIFSVKQPGLHDFVAVKSCNFLTGNINNIACLAILSLTENNAQFEHYTVRIKHQIKLSFLMIQSVSLSVLPCFGKF